MNKYKLVALSIVGGLFSGLAFSGWCTGLILLVSFTPFFIIENYIFHNQKNYSLNAAFTYLIPGFIIFSIIGIGWMRVASLTGSIAVILGLSFLMAFSLWLAHLARMKIHNLLWFPSVIIFWLGYEFLSLNVAIISPWLNLGNGLAKDIKFVQWYDLTGSSGGTLWILISNLILTSIITGSIVNGKKKLIYLITWLSIIIIPAGISIWKFSVVKEDTSNPEEIVIVQPNFDPYTIKFRIPFERQLRRTLSMAESSITDETDWVITPETTVDDPVNLDSINRNRYIGLVKRLTRMHPGLSVVTGMVTFRTYPETGSPPTVSARKTDNSKIYFDHFNSALKIDTGTNPQFYHKSKLVPGIEMQFSTGPGRFLSRILPFFGGTKWGYGIQSERSIFDNVKKDVKVGPVICYESVFGEFVTGYVKNGANMLFIITNDGWWKNTNGYKQHLAFASLRAIETRRPIARSGNTGISCLIDIKGQRIIESSWWRREVLRGILYPETRITPYVKYGDYIADMAAFLSIIVLILIFIFSTLRKK